MDQEESDKMIKELEAKAKVAKKTFDTLEKKIRQTEQELRKAFKVLDTKEAFLGLSCMAGLTNEEVVEKNKELLMRQLARPRLAILSREQQLAWARRDYRVGDVISLSPSRSSAENENMASSAAQLPAGGNIGAEAKGGGRANDTGGDTGSAEGPHKKLKSNKVNMKARIVDQLSATRFDAQENGAPGQKGLWKSMCPSNHFQRYDKGKTWHVIGSTIIHDMAFDARGIRPAISAHQGLAGVHSLFWL